MNRELADKNCVGLRSCSSRAVTMHAQHLDRRGFKLAIKKAHLRWALGNFYLQGEIRNLLG